MRLVGSKLVRFNMVPWTLVLCLDEDVGLLVEGNVGCAINVYFCLWWVGVGVSLGRCVT